MSDSSNSTQRDDGRTSRAQASHANLLYTTTSGLYSYDVIFRHARRARSLELLVSGTSQAHGARRPGSGREGDDVT